METIEVQVGKESIIFETGQIARQANGAVMVKSGGTAVLTTACAMKKESNLDYLPLTVNYIEKFYAAGKIPGGFFKREGRPGDNEILVSRLIDRPLRPLFPKGYRHETQIMATTMSTDQVNPPDILALNGASLALGLSDIPLQKLVGAVRVGLVDGQYVVNPTFSQKEESLLDLIIAGTEDAIVMVEGSAEQVSEEELLEGMIFAERFISQIVQVQKELVDRVGREKMVITTEPADAGLVEKVRSLAVPAFKEAAFVSGKHARQQALDEAATKVIDQVAPDFEQDVPGFIYDTLEDIEREIVRSSIIKDGLRVDGRKTDVIRPIDIQVDVFSRTHGSAVFTRGETQSIAITSLGTVTDEQRYDNIEGEGARAFMLHYNFPPFSVGEVSMRLSPGRREIGHGDLAERAIAPIMPSREEFPYTVRVVSEITESNGSSSMASVCSGTLSLLSAGVPIKESVAGIAMGLVLEGDQYAVLSDILGAEDHLGDMDFKVAGTREGITAFQMDVKVSGISREIMSSALEQARQGRVYILDRMDDVLSKPSDSISSFAPRILTLKVPQEKIGAIIGPAGKMIRSIIEQTGANVWIEDDGSVTISSKGTEGDAEKAYEMVEALAADVEVGKVYEGEVKRIMDFGAFIEVLPGKEGLCHISKLEHHRVDKVSDVLQVGDKVKVKVTEIDSQGRVNLSRKALLPKPEGAETGHDHKKPSGDRHHESERHHSGGRTSGKDRRPDRNRSEKGGQGRRDSFSKGEKK
jgi:polyribonucleotide nucleotidyltransferase